MTAEPFSLLRVEDLLQLRVEVINLRRDGTHLVREDPAAEALLMFSLPAQHISETVVHPAPGNFPETVPSFVSGGTTLVFRLPDGEDSVELSAEALLDWNHLRSTTVPDDPPDPSTVNVFGGVPRTAIEFPTRVLLGHEGAVEWATPRQAVALDGRCELFHAELHGENGGDALLRAFAAPGDRPPRTDLPLTDDNRTDLVAFTHDVELVGADGAPVRRPLRAERFVLTPLGASVRMAGAWEPVPGTNLASYHHVAELGRDQVVQVAQRGYLSTGHRALLIRTSERKFSDPGDGTSVAYLQQETRISVSEPEVSYGDVGFPHGGREMPFRSLRIVDTTTPPVVDHGEEQFWVTLEGSEEPYRFTVVGTDSEGRALSFTMPLLFVDARAVGSLRIFDYNDPLFEDRRTIALNGRTAALARPPDGAPGTTALPVSSVKLVMSQAPGHPLGALPILQTAQVRVPAVEQLTGLATESEVALHDAYLNDGMAGQATGAFLSLAEEVPVRFGAGKGGGVASPDSAVRAVTARAGLLPAAFADARAAAAGLGTDQLREIFGGAKLLGVINLFDLLDPVDGAAVRELAGLDDDEIRRRLEGGADQLLPVPIMRARELAAGREVRYLWKPRLRREQVDIVAGVFSLDLRGAALAMEATTVCSPRALQQSTVHGELKGFALDFAGIVRVDIGRLAFTTRPGSRPDLTAEGLKVRLVDALEFVNALKDLLPVDGFGKGAFVRPSPTGISAGYTLAVPAVQLGVFALSNVTLTAELTVPFDDRPVSFRFAVSERHQPFNLSVSLFGGGGFFSMIVSTRRVELVEGSLEFGGNASLDLGVASGGVHLMGGVYFALTGQSVTLTGYLRCGGYLSVLGVVSVSVEFYLQLTYVKDSDKHTTEVFGAGSLCVSVQVAVFTKSVTLSLQRRFGGSPADPGFADCVEPADWDRYCLAFAP
ncbi:hypothetical protein [Streptomyces sp. NRRL S-1448]|uniref:hypothetical protein n=1 Tax=Streptomyces sp. NRRL S-1448 TaxID=1463883 RepID=UPI0004BE5369|nr:hypothetical protein [Streptomyces sp. NRRL S-1448]